MKLRQLDLFPSCKGGDERKKWILKNLLSKIVFSQIYYKKKYLIQVYLVDIFSIKYACGDYCVDTKEKLVEVLYFRQFYRHFVFVENKAGNRNTRLEKYFEVSVVVDVGCEDTRNFI